VARDPREDLCAAETGGEVILEEIPFPATGPTPQGLVEARPYSEGPWTAPKPVDSSPSFER
jgi:hypothetical protein